VRSVRDWSIRRHRTNPRALGLTRAFAIGLAVVAIIAAIVAFTANRANSAREAGFWAGPPPRPAATASASPAPSTGPPTQLKIPAIKITTSLEPLGLDAKGQLIPPSYGDAGWYAAGTAPGDIGPAVIAGHIDSTSGPAVFFHLHELKAGDTVQVKRGGKWLTFQVTGLAKFKKTAFPTDEVYGPTPTAQLRLITCGGPFDTHSRSYEDNVIVFAVMTG
jgi:LPXTG-site transpeptidase (sortase) family protein